MRKQTQSSQVTHPEQSRNTGETTQQHSCSENAPRKQGQISALWTLASPFALPLESPQTIRRPNIDQLLVAMCPSTASTWWQDCNCVSDMFHDIRSRCKLLRTRGTQKSRSHQRQTWVKNSRAYAILIHRTQKVRTYDVSSYTQHEGLSKDHQFCVSIKITVLHANTPSLSSNTSEALTSPMCSTWSTVQTWIIQSFMQR